MSDIIKLKAYKMLAATYSGMFSSIRQRAMNMVEYRKDDAEEMYKLYECIANPDKWDYIGLLKKEDKAVLEVLEFLLNDEVKEPWKYKGWKPLEK